MLCSQAALAFSCKDLLKTEPELELLTHELSCDIDTQCYEYIRATQAPKVYVMDINDCSSSAVVKNVMTDALEVVPRSFCLVASWVCKDV